MQEYPHNKTTITKSKAVEILNKNGSIITEQEAEIILEFMYFIGKLAVNQYFNEFKDDETS